jgi:phosphoribosylanthranilate isomerase
VVDGFPVDIRLIKAISINGRDDIATYKPYEGLADYFLFDTKAQLPGGNGQQFDWSVLSAYDGNTPFLLSGGIGPDDAERLSTLTTLDGFPVEKCIGIDLNSRFEVSPALKDINKLKEFIKKVRI